MLYEYIVGGVLTPLQGPGFNNLPDSSGSIERSSARRERDSGTLPGP